MQPRSWVNSRVILAFLLSTLFLLPSAARASHSDERPQKTGILLVAFGTTIPEANMAYENIENRVRAEFPDTPIRWAYTSKKVRSILRKAGTAFDSPAEALAKMMDENFTHVAVLSLHVIPGEEYHGLVQTVHRFAGMPKGMQKVLVSYPLLSEPQEMQTAADALLSVAPKERTASDALIFMGHGTHHPGNIFYPAMQYYLWKKDKLAFVGTVEGSPSLDDVVAELQAAGVKKAYLMPLMAVAGDHARNDMAGDEEDSWKSILKSKGIKPVTVLHGGGEYDALADIWIDHLRATISHFAR